MITEMTAIKIFKENFRIGQTLVYVKDPVSWALYKTWEFVDAENKKGRLETKGTFRDKRG